MSGGRLLDISQRLRPALPVWPGDVAVAVDVTAAVSAGSSVTLHRLTVSTQAGTHAECSRHVRDDAPTLDELALSAFLGECEVRDVRAARERVLPADVLDRLPARVERVLLRTLQHSDWERWPEGFTALAPELIDALAARGCRLIGTDAPSIDPQTCTALRSHHAAHRAGMAILEGLVLDHITEGRYELIALPLPVTGIEATPVRAVLREFM